MYRMYRGYFLRIKNNVAGSSNPFRERGCSDKDLGGGEKGGGGSVRCLSERHVAKRLAARRSSPNPSCRVTRCAQVLSVHLCGDYRTGLSYRRWRWRGGCRARNRGMRVQIIRGPVARGE